MNLVKFTAKNVQFPSLGDFKIYINPDNVQTVRENIIENMASIGFISGIEYLVYGTVEEVCSKLRIG